jgi:hypothetical protein
LNKTREQGHYESLARAFFICSNAKSATTLIEYRNRVLRHILPSRCETLMLSIVECPACQVRLKVPEPPPHGPMLCPQCSAQVPIHAEIEETGFTTSSPRTPATPADGITSQRRPPRLIRAPDEPDEPALQRAMFFDPDTFDDPENRHSVLGLAIVGAVGVSVFGYIGFGLTFGILRDVRGLVAALPCFAVAVLLVGLVALAYRRFLGQSPFNPLSRAQAAWILGGFACAGLLVIATLAVLLLCMPLYM